MIGRLTGTLLEKSPPTICVDVHGVGYELDVPMSTLYGLPEVGAKVSLFTHLVVRDDAHILYGFASSAERHAFRQLLRVTGIGARTALSLLSGMTVAELAQAITLQEAARLTRVPGIGKKTAERLLLELRGKLGADVPGVGAPADAGQTDIVNALVALGYSEKESLAALKTIPAGTPLTEGIKLALKTLAR